MRKNVAGQKVTFSLFKAGARIANPTIAAGDFKVDLDGAGQANVATPPTSDAAGLVTWAPSQAETNADVVTFLGLDAAGAEWEPLTIMFDTSDATLAATQGAITWGQQKIVANVALEGALDIENTNAAGYGLMTEGDAGGAFNYSTSGPGQYNQSTAGQGQYNQGTSAGQYNRATAGSGTYNLGTTFGLRSAASAGVGLNASGTTYGLQATGTTNETDMGLCDVWACTPRTLTTVSAAAYAANSGGKITLHRGDTADIDIADLGNIAARTKLWFTLKSSSDDADTAAIVMIEETAGLMYLNGADASARAVNGDITVTDAAAGDITITLAAAETDDLTPGAYVYDVQMLTAAGVTTLTADDATVSADVTRRVA